MRVARMFGIAFVGLLLVCSVLVVSSAEAATQSTRLTSKVARPGTQWSSALTVNPGETVNVLIKYTNENKSAGQKYVTIYDTLPKGATFKPTSAYLFTPAAPGGVQQPDTLTTSGIQTGALKAGESAYIQFQMVMPSTKNIACGTSTLSNGVTAVNRAGTKVYVAQSSITITNPCPTAAPATNTVKPSAPASTSVTTSTTNSSNTSKPATSVSSTPATTVASTPTAAKTDEGSKTLVSTGIGNVFGIFAVTAIAGALAYRFILQRVQA